MRLKDFRINGGRVEVWKSLTEVAERAAALFASIAREHVAADGAFTVALSGGSTPKALYQLLASGSAAEENVPWPQTHVFWSDERCVPPDDPQSNYRLAHETLLAHVPVPEEQIHRMRGEDDPSRAAAHYASVLRQHLDATETRFSLILLGLGEDGHTASLFPNSPALDDLNNLVAAPFVEKLGTYRLTLTLRVLNRAANIIFLVSGEGKAEALRAVLEGKDDPHAWPARLIRPEAGGQLTWLVDEAAAAKLLPLKAV